MAHALAPYPVRVEAELDAPSRLLWLVKWILVIPHAVVLAFLWIAYCALTCFAFFAILFTGRYPRAAFEFNVGVLRWSWRVAYYTYSALGTDRYPPFTLAETADYPAHLEIAYPDHLSRGLVLVKWWLLALPHYIVVALLVGGAWFITSSGLRVGSGLIGILVLVAAVALAATGRYPQSLFDLVLGLNRWVLRVAAYAGLMTDVYPPFRLDVGGSEGGPSTLTVGPGTAGPATSQARGWTGPRIIALIAGVVLMLGSLGALGAGVTGLVYNATQRDAAGYIHTGMHRYTTSGYALTSEGVEVRFEEPSLRFARALFGRARLQVRPTGTEPVFVGVASTSDVELYLAGVERGVVEDVGRGSDLVTVDHGVPAGEPSAQDFWVASRTGTEIQSLALPVREGSWTVVVMHPDGSRGVSAEVAVGVTAPNLGMFAAIAMAIGALMLAGGAGLLIYAVAKSSGGGRS
jgi:hypothetical protein